MDLGVTYEVQMRGLGDFLVEGWERGEGVS